jgi:ketosteroid isomerase-like protein
VSGGDLEARLRAVEDERDIVAVMHGYVHQMDFGTELGPFLDGFTDDAEVVVVDKEGVQVHEVRGHAELEGFWSGLRELTVQHALANPLVTVVGDTATATSYYVAYTPDERGPRSVSSGVYEDDLVRGADGRWRFSKRTIRVVMMDPELTP